MLLIGVGCIKRGPQLVLPASTPSDHGLLGKRPKPFDRPGVRGGVVRVPGDKTITVVDFWSATCAPCLEAMPKLQALHGELRGQGVEVVGVAAEDDGAIAKAALAPLGVDYPQALDGRGQDLRRSFLVSRIPQRFVVDRTGRVRLVVSGDAPDAIDRIRAAVRFLLAEGR